MNYATWEARMPQRVRRDPLWRMKVYRLASYIASEVWTDAARLARCKVTVGVSAQLYRATGSIPANVAEGYSRSSGRDRARFFEYALGSSRESREWYLRAIPVLGELTVFERIDVLEEINRMLLAIIPRERNHELRRVESDR